MQDPPDGNSLESSSTSVVVYDEGKLSEIGRSIAERELPENYTHGTEGFFRDVFYEILNETVSEDMCGMKIELVEVLTHWAVHREKGICSMVDSTLSLVTNERNKLSKDLSEAMKEIRELESEVSRLERRMSEEATTGTAVIGDEDGLRSTLGGGEDVFSGLDELRKSLEEELRKVRLQNEDRKLAKKRLKVEHVQNLQFNGNNYDGSTKRVFIPCTTWSKEVDLVCDLFEEDVNRLMQALKHIDREKLSSDNFWEVYSLCGWTWAHYAMFMGLKMVDEECSQLNDSTALLHSGFTPLHIGIMKKAICTCRGENLLANLKRRDRRGNSILGICWMSDVPEVMKRFPPIDNEIVGSSVFTNLIMELNAEKSRCCETLNLIKDSIDIPNRSGLTLVLPEEWNDVLKKLIGDIIYSKRDFVSSRGLTFEFDQAYHVLCDKYHLTPSCFPQHSSWALLSEIEQIEDESFELEDLASAEQVYFTRDYLDVAREPKYQPLINSETAKNLFSSAGKIVQIQSLESVKVVDAHIIVLDRKLYIDNIPDTQTYDLRRLEYIQYMKNMESLLLIHFQSGGDLLIASSYKADLCSFILRNLPLEKTVNNPVKVQEERVVPISADGQGIDAFLLITRLSTRRYLGENIIILAYPPQIFSRFAEPSIDFTTTKILIAPTDTQSNSIIHTAFLILYQTGTMIALPTPGAPLQQQLFTIHLPTQRFFTCDTEYIQTTKDGTPDILHVTPIAQMVQDFVRPISEVVPFSSSHDATRAFAIRIRNEEYMITLIFLSKSERDCWFLNIKLFRQDIR